MNTFIISSNDLVDFQNQLNIELLSKKPTLCIMFADSQSDFKGLSQFISELDIDILGLTTCGEIANRKVLSKTITSIFLEIDKSFYKPLIVSYDDDVKKATENLTLKAVDEFKNPGMLLYTSGVGVNCDEIISTIKNNSSDNISLYGGLAGDNFKNEIVTVFINNRFETNGLAVIVFDCDKIEMKGDTFSGWKDLGKRHTVTKAVGNVLYEIDNKPALDLFREYFGDMTYYEGDRNVELPGMCALKVFKEDDSQYLRSPLLYNYNDNSLILGGEVIDGDQFKFCPPPSFDAIDRTLDHFSTFSQKFNDVDCVIINECAGRKIAFGPVFNKEVEQLSSYWNVPVVGGLVMGEIGNDATINNSNYHNVTLSLVTLKLK